MIDSSPTPALPKPIKPPTMPGYIDLNPSKLASWYDEDCIDQEEALAYHKDPTANASPAPYAYTIELELIPISPSRLEMIQEEELDAYPFCAICGKVLQEKWGAIGSCSCHTQIPVPLSLESSINPKPLLTLQEALQLDPEDGHPFCDGCGQVLEENYGAIGKCLCDEVNDENELDIEWDFCSQVLLLSSETSWLETIMEVDEEAEDAYPFCRECGKVLREGWGAVGGCSCGKMR